ncbi:polymorphic toxin-type HINT domain-containing protein [Streptomyces hundungensis]|uniref:polymorphic toxin-type HINT domain-containing protein n=1 Tax=Streptomyces hundungensis TaxID=1077946 RepID=UPI0033CC0F76
MNYSTFRNAYGGDWSARLHLVQLPACALTTPEAAQCRIAKPLKTTNNTKTGTLTATVEVPAAPSLFARSTASSGMTVLGATGGAAGSSGDYKATPLQSSGTWSAGGSTGAFNWAYPIGVPEVPGGMVPSLGIEYNSQTVDGHTAASNNQSSWIGDGWSLEPGFIERRYKPCNDDKSDGTNTTKVGDLCWYNDNATMSLNGKSSELIYDKDHGWHPTTDSGEKVEKLTGAANGDNNGEHWKITTTDGTQYFFGLNRLPGWQDHGADPDDPTTQSTWTVPVFGNQSGEPCYNASFADAWCQQAWRWQLDYVVDVHGNAMAYYWNTETNNYGRNVSDTTGKSTATRYTRGGWLGHIDYGLRSDTVYTAKAMGRVDFATDERCLSNCGSFDDASATNWPDVPFDQFCKDGAECKDQYAPSFWSRKRLTSITTNVLTGGGYHAVDSWALKQDFRPAGDGISTPMWLSSIARTGLSGGSAPLPPVTFAPVQRDNRVDKLGDGLAPFVRLRLSTIKTETGGLIGVDYSFPDCSATSLPPADATNTTRCYPLKWAYEGDTAKQDWFNSYVVTGVFESANLPSTPDKVTSYAYPGGAAWVKSTDEFTKAEDRSFSVARGYGLVQTRTGVATTPRTLSETRYFRGIEGTDVEDSAHQKVADHNQFAGMTRETAVYNGDDTSKLVAATSYTPYRSDPIARRPRAGLPDLESYQTGTQRESTRTVISSGTRTTEVSRHFDSYGLVDQTSTSGDTQKPGDEQCTTVTYARNTDTWVLDKVARTETTAHSCELPTRPGEVTGDTRTYYDNGALGTVTSKANITKVEGLNGKGDDYDTVLSVPSTCGTTKDQLCYDIYGRPLRAANALGKTESTVYTPATGEAPTSMVVTNALAHQATTVIDPLRAQPTQVIDANGKITTKAYDALGRATKIWTPARSAVTYPDSPNYAYSYLVRDDGPTVVTTKTLSFDSHDTLTSYAFYDGLLRPRETQDRSPDLSGRLISETFYDSRGRAVTSSGTYYADGAAEPVLVTGDASKFPSAVDTQYDGAGRATAQIAKYKGEETRRTTTSYTGDSTTVVPPQGGTATTTVVDALGRTTELREYTNADRTSSQSTTYSYDKQGHLDWVTDPSGATWFYGYDAKGRQTHVSDPDKGTTDTVYDQADRITDTTDARGVTLHNDYDDLGRRTALKQGSTTLAAWTYDTVAKGKPSTSTRYVDGKAYQTAITGYNALYQPTATQVTIPDNGGAESQLATTYKWTTAYYGNTGQQQWTKQPAMGDLPAETVTPKYKAITGQLDLLGAGNDPLVAKITYDHYGRSLVENYGALGQNVMVANTYDDHTGKLTDTNLSKPATTEQLQDSHYRYDKAGNLTAIATGYGQDAARTTDTQCFTLDALTRITQAWTNSGTQCADSPSDAVVGGKDAYWSTYSYDAVGNRKTETQHKTASGPAADTVRTYADPAPHTHKLPQVSQTGVNPHDETYSYDKAGNTQTRTSGTAPGQNLVWDAEGHLKSVTQGTVTTSYLYDADGQRLIRRDSTGTTLYLPGGNELHVDKVGLVTGTRYYSAGSVTAQRTGGKLAFVFSDQQGTGTTQISADAAQTVTRRKTTIFGAPRGEQPTNWTGDKGFVGGTKDADTGLIHLGAREYDPVIGRFISVDPVLALGSSQALNGYTYGDNNPVSNPDPTGMCADIDCPTRPNPNSENTTPGHVPAPEKRTEAGKVIDAEAKQSYIEVLPGVRVPKNWSHKDEFIRKLQAHIIQLCKGFGDSCFADALSNDDEAVRNSTRAQLKMLELQICGSIEGRCPKSVVTLREAAEAGAAAGMFAGGDGSLVSPHGLYAPGSPSRKFVDPPGGRPVGGPCSQCFLAGTEVLMADHGRKKIEDVRPGDEILATDPLTGESAPRKVTRLIVTDDDKHFNELTIRTGKGLAKLTATFEHPFWSPSEHRWLAAKDLKHGTTLLSDDGSVVTVEGNRAFSEHARTYNLTVEDLHTYYVLAGSTPVLVHNSGPNCGVPLGGKNGDHLGGEDFHGSEYSLDEIIEFVNGHTGDGNPTMGRPSATEVETALRQAGPRQLEGQNSSRFDHDGVRVIVNWDMPWKSTAYYPGR